MITRCIRIKLKRIMKRYYLYGLIILFLILNACNSEPKRQLVFFNSSNRTLNIVLEKDSVYVVDKFLEPKSIAYATVDTFIYNIIRRKIIMSLEKKLNVKNMVVYVLILKVERPILWY